jgi:hypothetical protein
MVVKAQVWTASKFKNSEHIKDPETDPNTVNPSERAIPDSEELDRGVAALLPCKLLVKVRPSTMRSLQRLMPLR